MLSFFREKNFFQSFVIWAVVILWYFTFGQSFLKPVRKEFQDIFARQGFYLFYNPPDVHENIVIVSIDESSRKQLGKKWPWDRGVTAELIENISSHSPRVVGLDMILSGKSRSADDEKLARGLQNNPNIILGYVLRKKNKHEFLDNAFYNLGSKIGFVNKVKDKRGVLNKTRTFFIDKKKHLSMDIQLVAEYLNIAPEDIKINPKKGIALGTELFIPSVGGLTSINYLVSLGDFKTIPAFMVLKNKIPPGVLKDKLVLVGATDPLIHDEYLTPLGVFPGVNIIANSITMMLSRDFIHELSFGQNLAIIFILGLIVLFISRKWNFLYSTIFTLVLTAVVFVGLIYLRGVHSLKADYLAMLILPLSSYLVFNIHKYSYFVYMNNKLKNLSVVDRVTGFYTRRYFLLKLNEIIAERKNEFTLAGIVIKNYSNLVSELEYKEVKKLVGLLSQNIKPRIRNKFKESDFSRLSQDTIGVYIRDGKNPEYEHFFQTLVNKINSTDWNLEDQDTSLDCRGVLLYKAQGKEVNGQQVISRLEKLISQARGQNTTQIISKEIKEESLAPKKRYSEDEFMDFLTSDLEARNKELEKALRQVVKSKNATEAAYFDSIRSLIKALEEKDTFTHGHSERVAEYALKMAREKGFSEEECNRVYKAGLLHDIGKIGIPDYVLRKKERLTDAEYSFIRRHSTIGVDILKPVKAFQDLLPIILYHHERIDGTGYPYGLSGDMIPKEAKVLSVADAFDAITSGRGYKKGNRFKEAIKELKRTAGKQCSVEYVEALQRALEIPSE